jgi:hypothetical protein
MSKTDTSPRLLATLRFTVASNSSRTLNATQAYDVTPSGITLASALGTLVDKDVAVKADASATAELNVGLTLTNMGGALGSGAEKATAGAGKRASSTATATICMKTVEPVVRDKKQSANNGQKCDINSSGSCIPPDSLATTLSFTGSASAGPLQTGLSNKSKATNPNTVFYGGIPVGTGDYKKWQGKYAVLKINTVTGKGVLRIYDA